MNEPFGESTVDTGSIPQYYDAAGNPQIPAGIRPSGARYAASLNVIPRCGAYLLVVFVGCKAG
jgi:hypothetical protein